MDTLPLPHIVSSSGVTVTPLAPQVDQFRLIDVAHSLSAMPRFAGHTSRMYSVAEHCTWVSQHLPPELARHGLLHDAPRAYLMDLRGPHKRGIPAYGAVDNRIGSTIYKAFGLDPYLYGAKIIQAVDDLALLVEWRDLKRGFEDWWGVPEDIIDDLDALPAASRVESYENFLDHYQATISGSVRDNRWEATQRVLERLNGWRPPVKPGIVTLSGRIFDPSNPDPASISVKDIATALSRMPRFAGHTSQPYSVAQHSLFVASLCPPALKLKALFHDASEAYLIDMPSPIKKRFPAYVQIENQVQSVIEAAFGIPSGPKPEQVHAADEMSLYQEIRDLMPASQALPAVPPGVIDHLPPIDVMAPEVAEAAFMEEAARLLHGQRQTQSGPNLRL